MCRNLDLRFLFFIVFCQSFFPCPFSLFFWLSVLLSFLLLSNWFLFLSSFVFPLLFRHCFIPVSLVRHCFIPVSLAHVVSSLAYPNLLGTKMLGCCCYCIQELFLLYTVLVVSCGSYNTNILKLHLFLLDEDN
jgi:hypothetical protein